MSSLKIKYHLLATAFLFGTAITTAQVSTGRNYVVKNEMKKPGVTTQAQVDALTITDRLQGVGYFDGLGRPLQNVTVQASPNQRDIVAPVEYDGFGREIKKFLPYTDVNSTVYGSLRTTAYADQRTFYNPSSTWVTNIQKDTMPFAQSFIEFSPYNRLLEQGAQGAIWQPGSGHGVKPVASFNTVSDSVRKWVIGSAIGSIPTTSAIYPDTTLFKHIAYNEHGKQVIEYKDKEGKILLKKIQLSNTPGTAHVGWLCTYYVYDDFNLLRFVIQPRGLELISPTWTITQAIADEFCFRYEYDERQRMSIKKIPGAGQVFMVYDARDRVVMVQDSNLRIQGKWMVTEYESQNRPWRTSLWNDANTRAYHQNLAGGSVAYPTLSGTYEILSETYYDNYSWVAGSGTTLTSTLDATNTANSAYFITAYNITPIYAQPITASYQTRGMVTGSKVKVLGTASQYLYTVSFYDERGRVIQVQTINITGGKDIGTTQYDFSGKPLRNYLQHTKSGTLPQSYTMLTKMDYDHAGRLLTIKKTFNGGTEQTVATNTYDEIGQLKTKTLGSSVESLTYDYNIRGWMLGVNRNFIKDAATNYFGYELGYENTANIITGATYANVQFNGNISGTTWKGKGDNEKRKYDFTYDNINRLTAADFNQYTSNAFNKTAGLDFSVSNLSYDANGNIMTMNQKGWKLTGSVTIDQLAYTYQTNSNKLDKVIDGVSDAATKLGDFHDGPNGTTTDYSYDGNGNLTLDNNKSISAIAYNYLNLPGSITVTAKGTIAYTYDAGGNKLKKVTTEGAKVTTTLYLGAFNYINDTLQFVAQEEGRIRPKTLGNTANGFAYDYFLRDHLGNIRMVLTDEVKSDMYPAATMETATATTEETYYANLPQTRVVTPAGYPGISGNVNVAKVSAATGSYKVGPSITLKVMAKWQ